MFVCSGEKEGQNHTWILTNRSKTCKNLFGNDNHKCSFHWRNNFKKQNNSGAARNAYFRNSHIPVPSNMIIITWLTPRKRVLPEKLTGPKLVKKLQAFYGTRRSITAFTTARPLSLSSARLIQSKPRQPTSSKSISITVQNTTSNNCTCEQVRSLYLWTNIMIL